MVRSDHDGTDHLVTMVGPGQLLGYTSFSRGTTHTRAARAASDAVIFKLTRDTHERIVDDEASTPLTGQPAETPPQI